MAAPEFPPLQRPFPLEYPLLPDMPVLLFSLTLLLLYDMPVLLSSLALLLLSDILVLLLSLPLLPDILVLSLIHI